MRKIFTSLIVLVICFCAFSLMATAKPAVSASFDKSATVKIKTMNLIEPFQKVCRNCADVFQTHSFSHFICINCSVKLFEQTATGTDSVSPPPKTETPKRVNPQKTNGFGYNGNSFANLIRARP